MWAAGQQTFRLKRFGRFLHRAWARYTDAAVRRIVIYGLLGGLLLALLQLIEYKYFIRAYPAELYGGIIAVIFAGLGIYLGLTSRRDEAAISDVPGQTSFELDEEKLDELGITPREHEILGLIAEGLSNREIGERLFVSENTIKTHSSRLFQKLGVNRRTQAVRKGRGLRLIP